MSNTVRNTTNDYDSKREQKAKRKADQTKRSIRKNRHGVWVSS